MLRKAFLWFIVAVLSFALLNYLKFNVTERTGEVKNGLVVPNEFCRSTYREIDDELGSLLSLLNRITSKSYFRYFKVNTNKQCPFWVVNLLCTSKEDACSVCRCDENSIPKELREETDMSDCRVPDANILQSTAYPLHMDSWGPWKSTDSDSEYVDLLENPEANTGFSGPMAVKVWQSIYKDNCFELDRLNCTEASVFQTLLSGLQTSIGIQVCTNFYQDKEFKSILHKSGIYNNLNISFFPNCKMYHERLQGNQKYIDNLYTLFQFTLRALTKAKHSFIDDINELRLDKNVSANSDHSELYSDLLSLYNLSLFCKMTFDETVFMESTHGKRLLPQMKSRLVNVSQIMDCVPCEKCRLWGKLSIKGIDTAMDINMNTSNNHPKLNRAQKFTLINLARQLTFSLRSFHLLKQICTSA